MITREKIAEKARELGFEDIGFTTAEPFDDHRAYLEAHGEEYGWAEDLGLALRAGTDPRTVMPAARSIIVLLDNYYRQSFPAVVEHHFGRCYLDDDRVTKDGMALRLKAFRTYLRDNGIDSKVPFNLPHRLAAARAGLGTFGKNCLFYAGRTVRKGSWVIPITVVVDHDFEADASTVGMGCPDWCRNACIAACPTRALTGNGRIDPRRCISFLSYYGQDLTPRELREPMGMYVYGCDRCQDVCPRNSPWLAQDLPVNQRVAAKAENFDLVKLLHMDRPWFEMNVWPHMFYMSGDDLWRWRMNVARVMGNSQDRRYVPDLVRAFDEHDDARVRGMIAWALGRLGGDAAREALAAREAVSCGMVKDEIDAALADPTSRQRAS